MSILRAETATETRRPTLPSRARRDLQFIRRTMSRASSFTAVPGVGGVLMGVIGAVASVVAGNQVAAGRWLVTWLVAAAVAATIGLAALLLKSRRARVSLLEGPGARFLLSLLPPFFAGVLFTWVLVRGGRVDDLPGVWLLMYGVTVLTGGAFSIRAVLVMGASFFLLGIVTLFAPVEYGNLLLGVGFGGLHVLFGARIARCHGG